MILPLLITLLICYCLYNAKGKLALYSIRILHFLYVLFILMFPFLTHDKTLLKCYIIIILFMMFHWIVANDTCALTLAEQYVSGRQAEDTFTGSLVKPVYNIRHKHIWYVTIFLLIFSVAKVLL